MSFERNIASFRFANKLFLVEVLREYINDMPGNNFFHFLLLCHPFANDVTSWIRNPYSIFVVAVLRKIMLLSQIFKIRRALQSDNSKKKKENSRQIS